MTRTIAIDDLAGTRRLGRTLGRQLRAGDVLCLIGDLGAGKTTFTQALAEGLDVPVDDVVNSPTFTLVAEHWGGRVPLFHFDAYRLQGADDLEDLAFDDYLDGRGVVVMEWADKVLPALPADRLEIHFADGESVESRMVTLIAEGARSRALLLGVPGE
jgi:tRNA threonylcarbamoyladenosine biosynthesis protein TsaE